jgi:hypothetical protein
MSSYTDIINPQEILNRLYRKASDERPEVSVVTSPGGKPAAWVIKIKSLSSYNIYNVRAVVIGEPGSSPTEIGQQTKAVNVAEPFDQAGQLSASTYTIMFSVGGKNVFYVQV